MEQTDICWSMQTAGSIKCERGYVVYYFAVLVSCFDIKSIVYTEFSSPCSDHIVTYLQIRRFCRFAIWWRLLG
jgi:hypothetical protein